MDQQLQVILKDMKERFDAESDQFRDIVSITIPRENILEALIVLKGFHAFNMLLDITSVDYFPQISPRFHVVYTLYSMEHNLRIRLRTHVEGDNPQLPTSEKVYTNANWYEREIYDLMGIQFEGHSDPRRIVLPEDWVGHPLRKDYPQGYEEVQFTFNYEEIQGRKPKPKK